MSYILDALKKSERERRQSSMPGPQTLHENISSGSKRRSLWPYLIIAALALNAAIFAFWTGIFYPEKPTVTAKSTSGKLQELNKQDTRSLPSSVGSESGVTIEENKRQKINPLSDTGGAKKIDGIHQNQSARINAGSHKKTVDPLKHALDTNRGHEAPSVAYKQAAVEHVPPEPRPDNDSSGAVPNRIYNLGELPLTVRQNLPAFSVSVFLYSDDPASRLVKINGQMMKEGQYLAEGLKLEEIIPNGVLFSYHNYRFHIDLK
jgi:general secretion pathway protein B